LQYIIQNLINQI